MPRAIANPTRRRTRSQQPTVAGDTDAALIAAAAEHAELQARYASLAAVDDSRFTATEEMAWDAQENAIFARQAELRKWMQRTPAMTRKGLEAKAQIAIAWLKECRADEAGLTLSLIDHLIVS